MATKQIEPLQKEVGRNFNLLDASLPLNLFPWREQHDLASEDHDPILIEEDDTVVELCSFTWSEYAKSMSMPEYGPSLTADNRAGSASPVRPGSIRNSGTTKKPSHAMHDEADSYTTLIRQVGEYIDSVDFVHGTTYSIYGDHVEADVLYPRVDSDDVEMFYEPQLWCFI